MRPLIALLILAMLLISLPAAAQDDGCLSAFDDAQAYADTVIETGVAEMDQTFIDWDSDDWDEIVRRVVVSGEYFLNNCTNPDEALAVQIDDVADLTAMTQLDWPVESVDPGGDFAEFELVDYFDAQYQFIDLNADGADELVITTQLPYFSSATLFEVRGGLGIAYFYDEDDGWQGQVIAPVTEYVTNEDGDHLSYAMTPNDNTLSVDDRHEALAYYPFIDVETFTVDDGETTLTAVRLFQNNPVSLLTELNIISWDGRIPSVELRIAFDDWCYPGTTLTWRIDGDGSVYVPSNGNEAGSPLHCGRTPEALYVWEDGAYTLADSD